MPNDTGGSFPHPLYARYVLEPAFRESKQHLFQHMIAANEAHAIMLAECGVIEVTQAAALLAALRVVQEEGVGAFGYAPAVEDLFFAVEKRLIQIAGPDAGGNLQIGRSRNDLAAAMSRMMLRERLLAAREHVLELRTVLLELIHAHIETLMPGITHTQPAQPTTLAHYLLGVLGPLERDSDRLAHAWRGTNRSALGVAAFTTTSFPINRGLTADLLGFDGYVENGYDAVGASDHFLEAVHALVNCVGSLSRFVYDLLIWTRQDVDMLRVDDAFIQISSIMPQKRNPVVLEHVRVRIGWVYGEATAVETIVHSAAFGDTNDVEDPLLVPLNRAFDAAEMGIRLLAAVLATATFSVAAMARRAGEGNTTTTALADALVRRHGIPFRSAHTIVSRLVTRVSEEHTTITAGMVNEVSATVLEAPLRVTEQFVREALDPSEFIRARAIPGGPAPEATRKALVTSRARLDKDQHLVTADRDRLGHAGAERQRRVAAMIG